MDNFETISSVYKICWLENFDYSNQLVMQASGFIFDDENNILIVKSGKNWTIPGGHPEPNENNYIDTLLREVMEEASVTIKDIKYLGSVKVLDCDNNKNLPQTYYQLRYFAKIDKILPFSTEWETSERKFVPLNELINYITWSNGITFSKQLECAKKNLK